MSLFADVAWDDLWVRLVLMGLVGSAVLTVAWWLSAVDSRARRARFAANLRELERLGLARAVVTNGAPELRFKYRGQRVVVDFVPNRSLLDAVASWTLAPTYFGGLYTFVVPRIFATTRVQVWLTPAPNLAARLDRLSEPSSLHRADPIFGARVRELVQARAAWRLGMATGIDRMYLVTRELNVAELQSLLEVIEGLFDVHLDGVFFSRPSIEAAVGT